MGLCSKPEMTIFKEKEREGRRFWKLKTMNIDWWLSKFPVTTEPAGNCHG